LLEVRVTEAKTFRTEFGIDNARSPSVGSFRRTGQINEANLLGLGDELSVAYSNTDGSDSLDASYILPINARNGTLSFAYGTTSSDVIEEPFNFLDINANSRYAELTLRQPVVQSPRQEFALGLTLSRRQTQAKFGLEELEGEAFPSPGADEEGRTRLSALRFFQEWTQRSSREVLAFRSQFSVGLGILGAIINNESPDSRFFSWRGQGQWVRLLAPDTLLLLRTDLQIADRAILPIEQFGLGGQQSVRGYRQDLLLADNGAFASAEVRLPIIRRARQEPILLLIPFVDVGAVWNNSDTPPPRSTLASVGLGLQWQIGRLTARLDWGIPLVDIDSRGRTWQENGIHFSVRYNPF
jgi:hemolysin activation/secretion protein